ncbi:Chloroplast stem-loop binding protein of 41 kDa b, chloroplastic isoform B [Glycine soja]|uniref:Chloroplast stem-loop binding protein of 41 kDa b, chloroplastic isoform B n=1 Tax=Glycine soja TaxID=3848 RepID=A0A445FKG5_GLYSO|nr:Chloroplast stem-loop binding protein of 41 kDa b, chloroplastic isoform B [Glycine soja]
MARVVALQQNQLSFSPLASSLSDFSGTRLQTQLQFKRKLCHPKGSFYVSASSTKKILIMGGTRFIGVFLSRLLVKEGHQVTLFTRGKAPVTQQLPGESDNDYADFSSKILHLKGDRKDFDFVKSSLSAEGFDVVYDINGVQIPTCSHLLCLFFTYNFIIYVTLRVQITIFHNISLFIIYFSGREADEVEPILDALPNLEQFIYCSSAGVYLKSDLLPHAETDAVDPKSRHKGKLETESLLQARGVNWTSIRPVYIYGPLNYNPVEEWFFHRLKAGRPIPIPSSGLQITQLGHVKDLATAFIQVLGNEKASKEVFNISGEKYVTFDGLARACAKAGGFPEPEIIHYNPKDFDFGKKKSFPFRDQHFFASIEKAKRVLGWEPEFGLVEGLADSYNLDFGRGTYRKEADFSTDDIILGKSLR